MTDPILAPEAFLAEQRRQPSRQPAQVVEAGEALLESGKLMRLGDELWATLEQIGIAALELGRWELAELCVARIHTRFPDSSRVSCLQGMLLEARGELSQAFDFYNDALKADETNAMLSKRRVAVLKALPSSDPRGGLERAAAALVSHLDAFYADAEAWLELAAIYTELHLFSLAIFALEELILLTPHDAFVVQQHSETLLAAGHYARAYAGFLRVLELCGSEAGQDSSASGSMAGAREGPWVRALWSLKTVIPLLRSSKATDDDFKPEKVDEVDALVTDLLLNRAYSSKQGDSEDGRDARLRCEGVESLLAKGWPADLVPRHGKVCTQACERARYTCHLGV